METEANITFDMALGESKTVSQEVWSCAGGHKVDGKTPMLHDTHLDQRTCDCGRLKYIVEDCGCPSNPTKELHGYPNEQ